MNATLLGIQKKVNGRWVMYTEHAISGMEASGISRGDVEDVIMTATDCTIQSGLTGKKAQQNGRIRIEGEVAERPLRVIVDPNTEPEVVVISAHWITGESE